MEAKHEMKKSKKREKIVIHYEDGTTEEHKTAILYHFDEVLNENNEKALRLTGKHCNTKHLINEFTFGLSHIVMAMLEDGENIERFYNE